MNPNEMKMISDLADQLKSMNISSSEKDIEADKAIQEIISPIPDVLYKLVQVALVQHMAVEQLRNQVVQLKALQSNMQAAQSAPKGFLDDLKEKFLGKPAASPNTTTPNYAQPQQPSLMPSTPTSSGFLGQAMTIGTGVAGGMLLGNAIESLFSHHSSASGFNSSPNEVIENNYLPDPSQDNLTINNQPDSFFDSDNDDSSSFDDSGSDW